MILTGKEAMEKLQEKLRYDTKHDAFMVDSTDFIVDCNKSPRPEGERDEEEADQ